MSKIPPDIDQLALGVLSNDKMLLGKAITLIESTLPSDMKLTDGLLRELMPHTGKSVRIGITGVPGVGKSTFIESFGTHIAAHHKIAVLAIDPSSKKTKGSILGDKTRMTNLATHPNAFIRPSPAGITMGGVAAKTREVMLLCEAAGYEVVIVETVGVGQSETEVYEMVDFFLLLMLAGAGDELQGIKKGILEMADLIAINKADGENKIQTAKAKIQLESALHLFPEPEAGFVTQVLTCSAIENIGIYEIWDTINNFIQRVKESSLFDDRRKKQNLYWFYEYINRQITSSFYNSKIVVEKIGSIKAMVENGKISPQEGGRMLLNLQGTK